MTNLRFAIPASDRVRLMPLLADYERETGVVVSPVTFGDHYRALSVELTRNLCSFDLVSIDDPWIPIFAGGRFLLSLDALGQSTGQPLETADFLPNFLSLGLAPDTTELFAIPWQGNVQLYGYDEAVFGELGLEAPSTWTDAVSTATRITAELAPNVFGAGLRGRPGNSAASTFFPILRGYGLNLFDSDWEPQLETETASSAMATLLALAEQAPPDLPETGFEEFSVQVLNGRIAQSADLWPSQLFGWSGMQMEDPAASFMLSALPVDGTVEASPITGNWLLGIPAACGDSAGPAFEFIRWLISPAQQERMLLESGLPPTRFSVMDSPTLASRQPLLPYVASLAKLATPRPRTPLFPAVEQIVGQWVAEAIAGTVTGDQALTYANNELRSVMKRATSDPT